MDKQIKQTINNLSRSASNMEDDAEFIEVAPLHQLDIMELCLMGVHHGVQQHTINPEELDTLRMYWGPLSANVHKLVYINKYYRLLLEGEEIPEDLQEKIDRWSNISQARQG